MPGRPDFSQAGTQRSGQTVATNNRPEVEGIIADASTTVAAGDSETVEVYAPTTAIFNVFAVRQQAPAPDGAASGAHRVVIKGAGGARATYAQSSFDQAVNWDYAEFRSADVEQRPSDPVAAVQAIQALKATENEAIVFHYFNSTDDDQTGTREYRLGVEEVSY